MTTSIYQSSIPILTLGLNNLSAILDKAAVQTSAKSVDSKTLAGARLIIDMLPLSKQVQIACDSAKGAAARLAGIDNPTHEDNEETIEQLKARIEKTLKFISQVTERQLAGSESKEIVIAYPNVTLKFSGLDFLTKFALPNFYFHITMAYAIIRANGVDVGKMDYLGKIQ
jgi:hypothetical protein